MPALREIFAQYDIEFDRRGDLARGNRAVSNTTRTLRQMDRVVERTSASLRNMARVVGGAFRRMQPHVADAGRALAALGATGAIGAAAGIQQMVSSTVESTREIERWAGRLSISGDALRSWIELGREYGASVDDVTDALKELQLKAQDALSGGTAQAEMFQRIGISLNDLRPVVNDADRLMELFTTRLNRVNDVALRNFTVDELMSDAGTRLNQVFALGTEEIQRRRSAITRAIGPTTQLTGVVAEHARRVINVSRRWRAFQRLVTMRVLPIVHELMDRIAQYEEPLRRMAAGILDVVRNSNLLEGALIGVAAVAVVVAGATISAWGPAVAVMAAMAVAVGAVAGAYDQVSRTIEGSDTSLRRFLDNSALLGEGGTHGLVLLLGDAWARIPLMLEEAANGARLLANDFQLIMTQLGPISAVLQQIVNLMQYIPGIRLATRVFGGVRSAAQSRAAQERSKERARTRDRNLRASAGEGLNPITGLPEDASGRPMSVDLSAIDVVPLEEPAAARPPSPSSVLTPRQRLLTMTPGTGRGGGQNVSVDSPVTMNFDVSGVSPDETVNIIRRETPNIARQVGRDIATQITALTPDTAEVGS